MPNKLCSFFRVDDCLGVEGLELSEPASVTLVMVIGAGIPDGRFVAFGVAGVMVVFVAVVVEDSGRD